MSALRVWRIPYSTNVERVALAAGQKGLSIDWVDVDASDRSAVERLSGQQFVPVLEAGDQVLSDSTAIIEWIEREYPQPPLYPFEPAARAQTAIAIEWFNSVWKRPPNAIHDELALPAPDAAKIAAWSAVLRGWLPWFEGLLDDQQFLLGGRLSAFDVCAFPFLKYGLLPVAADDADTFHPVLAEHLALGAAYPRLAGWIERLEALPRA